MNRRDVRQNHVLRRDGDVRPAQRQLRAGRRTRGRLVFVLLRGGFDGLAAVVPYGDPAYRSLRGSFAFQESDLVTLDDTFGLAPGLAPLRDVLGTRRARRGARDGDSLSNAQPLRRPGHSRDGPRSARRVVGRMVEPAAAGHVRQADRHRDRGRHAAFSHRPYEVETWSPSQLGAVDDAYLERLARLYRADAVLHEPLRGGAATAGAGRRGADGARQRAAWRHHAADAGGGAHPAPGGRAEHRRDGVQRMGHPREPGTGRRRARPAARTTRRWAGGVPHRHGHRLAEHHRRRDDRVRTHGASQRHAGHRSRHRGGGIRPRPARGAVARSWPTGPAWPSARCSKDAT